MADVEAAPPTAELEPIRSNYSQVIFCSITPSSSGLESLDGPFQLRFLIANARKHNTMVYELAYVGFLSKWVREVVLGICHDNENADLNDDLL